MFRRCSSFALALALVGFVMPATGAYAAEGDPEPAFGIDGVVSWTPDVKLFVGALIADDAAGRILVVELKHGDHYVAISVFTVRRFLPDGRLDTSFGNAGVVDMPLTRHGRGPTGLETLPDGT